MDEPKEQRDLPHPRLGFFGVIDERFDIELLRVAAESQPDWQFVMVGPVVKIDWDIALREERNEVHPVGLFDLDRKIRKVGIEYRRLIEQWREFLPAGTSALMLV